MFSPKYDPINPDKILLKLSSYKALLVRKAVDLMCCHSKAPLTGDLDAEHIIEHRLQERGIRDWDYGWTAR